MQILREKALLSILLSMLAPQHPDQRAPTLDDLVGLNVHESFGVILEQFPVRVHTKIIVPTLERGLWRGRNIDIHFAYRTQGPLSGRYPPLRIGLVRVGVHPTQSLVFQIIRGAQRNGAPVISLHHSEREIDPGGKAARACEVAGFDESCPALDRDVGITQGQIYVCPMVGRGGLPDKRPVFANT